MAGADGNAETVSRQWVTAGIFDVLGVIPIAGRTFSRGGRRQARKRDRDERGVLAHPVQRRSGRRRPRDPVRRIALDCGRHRAEDFQLMGQSSIWAMRPVVNLPPRARAAYVLHVVGRMKPGVSIEAAAADLGAVADNLAREFPQTNKGRLERMHDSIVGSDLRLPPRRRISGSFDRGRAGVRRHSHNVSGVPSPASRRPTGVADARRAGRGRLDLVRARCVGRQSHRLLAPLSRYRWSRRPAPVRAHCVTGLAEPRSLHSDTPAFHDDVSARLNLSAEDSVKGVFPESLVMGRPDETAESSRSTCRWRRISRTTSFSSCGRTSGAAEALAPSVRAAISRVDREQLVSVRSVMTLEDIARAATGRHRFRAVMVMAFAALALVLAMVGVFGILAYTVQQSVRDIGVRRALGATTHDVLRHVLVNALRVVGAGRRNRTRAGRHERPLDRDDAVRGTAARSDHVRARHDRAGNHGRAVDRRTCVACGTHRPRRRPPEHVESGVSVASGFSRIFGVGGVRLQPDLSAGPTWNYSCRRAVRGSTVAARLAGTYADANPMTSSVMTAAASVTGSFG